jgi:uncharacterized sulfatase
VLGQAGYVSLQTGKWWEGAPQRAGFTQAMTHGDPQRGGRHGDEGLRIGRQGLQPVFAFLADAKRQGRPFLLWYAPMLPHTPHNPPARLWDHYRDQTPSASTAKYWAMCEWFDATCGQLLDHLEIQGLSDQTLVVYLCDNGWITHPDRSEFAPKSKRSPYDGGVRTPIMLRWPKRIAPRREETALASSIDIVPTVLTACGIKLPPGLPGIDLLDERARSQRKQLYGEIYSHNIADVQRPAASLHYRWTTDGQWKLILPYPPNVPGQSAELYDLTADPREERNLAVEHPDLVGQLTRKIEAWWLVSP